MWNLWFYKPLNFIIFLWSFCDLFIVFFRWQLDEQCIWWLTRFSDRLDKKLIFYFEFFFLYWCSVLKSKFCKLLFWLGLESKEEAQWGSEYQTCVQFGFKMVSIVKWLVLKLANTVRYFYPLWIVEVNDIDTSRVLTYVIW